MKIGDNREMKTIYQYLSIQELEKSLKELLPGVKEFEVEFTPIANQPVYLDKQILNIEEILEIVGKQGFRLNDVVGIGNRKCIGITLDKPYKIIGLKDRAYGFFVLGRTMPKVNNPEYLFSFLIAASKSSTENVVHFSVDILARNKAEAQSLFLQKIDSFIYPSEKDVIEFTPSQYKDGEWVEMEPEEDPGEIRFCVDELNFDIIDKLF